MTEREKRVQICSCCGLDRHDTDAVYCKKCGEGLPDGGNG